MYKNPINLVEHATKSLTEQIENNLVLTVQKEIGWDIDKEELLKALQYDRDQYFKGYHDGRLANRWVPVSERLPESNGYYLVTEKSGRVCTYVFHKEGNSEEYWKRCTVAWMLLPQPYKVERED